ncbi:MAG TPA: hypothetical protein VES42_28850 [Pilimelia sp.]|nr:hypothetical protein [Pilimelia sp.]
MSHPTPPGPVAAALLEFVARIDPLDPAAGTAGGVAIRVGDEPPLPLSAPVAGALVAALRSYHDPRDRGRCDHCGGRRLDDNLLCADCGQPSGVFGQLLREKAARYGGPPPAVEG